MSGGVGELSQGGKGWVVTQVAGLFHVRASSSMLPYRAAAHTELASVLNHN